MKHSLFCSHLGVQRVEAGLRMTESRGSHRAVTNQGSALFSLTDYSESPSGEAVLKSQAPAPNAANQ